MRNLILTILLLSVTLVWGWTFTLVKDVVENCDISWFLAIRFTLGSMLLAILVRQRISRDMLRIGVLIGVVLGVSYMFQTLGLRDTTATNSGLITGLFVAFAPFFNRVIFGVKSPLIIWCTVAVAIAGLLLLVGIDPTQFNLGDLWSLACAAGFGLHIAMLDRWSCRLDSITLAAIQTATAAVMFWGCVLVGFLFAGDSVAQLHSGGISSAQFWSAILITGVLATAFGFGVQTAAQKSLPAVRVALILTMEPVFATMFGYLLHGDRLSGMQIVGAVLIVGAMIGSELIPAFARGLNTD